MAADREAFEARIDRSGGHHLWTGTVDQSGTGQIRIDGKLRSPASISWELHHGQIPPGHRIYSCSDVRGCIHPDHISARPYGKPPTSEEPAPARKRAEKGSGSIQQVGDNKWKLTVDAGKDRRGKRRRITRTIAGSKTEANRALATLNVEVQNGERVPIEQGTSLTVTELVHWYATFARDVRGLERTTVVGYREVFDTWLAPHIGSVAADRLTPAQVDEVFGMMRAEGKSHSRMNNARAALSGAYKWGRRHEKVHANPMRGFELPKSSHVPRKTVAPELHEVRRIIEEANHFDPEIAPVLTLAATTGMRRGELAGLRRDRLRLSRGELIVERAISEIGGEIEDKPTKNHATRTVRLDEGTIAFVRSHLSAMDQRAAVFGRTVADNGFFFSITPDCSEPMRPELMTRRMRQLRKHLKLTKADFDASILAMRKWTSTELMDAGFNPSAVSGRQGHTVQVMLNNYSSRRTSADQAAADHLGSLIFSHE